MPEDLLPKPQTDLPLPEKQLPAHATVKEEPINIPQKPNYIGTPAHPFPKFLSKKILIIALIFWALIMALIYGVKFYSDKQTASIVDFETCAAAGYPIAESYPATCRTDDGRIFTEVLNEIQQDISEDDSLHVSFGTELSYTIEYPTSKFIRVVCPETAYDGLNLITRPSEDNQSDDVENRTSCARGGGAYFPIQINTFEGTLPTYSSNDSYRNIIKENIVVDGVTGERLISEAKESGGPPMAPYIEQVRLFKNNKTYILSLSSKELKPYFNQIISTFKFKQ